MRHVYKIVPAPTDAPKVKGVRGAAARYASGLEGVLAEMARGGWEYLRADTMPVTAAQGFLRRKETRPETFLVFRRAAGGPEAAAAAEPEREVEPDDATPLPDYLRERPRPGPAHRPAPRAEMPVFSRRPPEP